MRLAHGGESLTVEFKHATKRDLNDTDIVEAVTCLANAAGGTLLLGVEDDGAITGCEARHEGGTDPVRLAAMIVNGTVPPISTKIEVVDVAGAAVVVVEVPKSDGVVGTSKGRYLKRGHRGDGEPECRPMSPAELMSSHFAFGSRDFAATPISGATWSDLDPTAFDEYREATRRSGGDVTLADLDDRGILQALALAPLSPAGELQVTYGAVLMFGSKIALRTYVPNHEVLLQVMDGTSVKVNEPLVAPLVACAKYAVERLQSLISEEELQWGMLRVTLPLVSPEAVREAIANALVHRDYTARGPIRVTLTRDRFTVASPGGLPVGMSVSNLVDHSMPRSPLLADALKRAGVVERTGRGIARMIETSLRAGRSEPTFSRTTDSLVVADFPLGRADLDLVRFLLGNEDTGGPTITLNGLRVVNEVRAANSVTVGELSASLGLPEATLRPTLMSLVEGGILELRGAGRGRRYHLASVFYRYSDQRAAYLRVRGTDPMQQEQMVLRWVGEYGSITRGDAANLCMITGQQATALLQRLRDAGRLEMVGERRTARYVLPPPAAGAE